MKKSILVLGTAIFLVMGSLTISSCQSNETKTEVKEEATAYQCPMKCEGEKTYTAPGQCPKCGMDIKKMDTHEGHKH